jgi:hypothetical protein
MSKRMHQQTMKLFFVLTNILICHSSNVISSTLLNDSPHVKRVGTITQEDKLIQDDVFGVAEVNSNFGWSLSIESNTMLIGAPNIFEHGITYIYESDGIEWIEKQIISPINGGDEDRFGESVLLHGEYAFIGARNTADKGYRSGAVYVYKKTGNQWVLDTKLLASDGEAYDYFGGAISVYGDTLMIGAYGDDDIATDSGAVYIFENVNGEWLQSNKITASDGEDTDYFGAKILINGNKLLVSSVLDDDNGIDSGTVYFFEKDSNTNSWILTSKITPMDGAEGDRFGSSLSLQNDLMVISSYFDGDNGYHSGSAYIFSYINNNWTETTKLLANDGQSTDYFGISTKIANNRIAIGSIRNSNGNGNRAGAVYLYSYINGSWIQSEKLITTDGEFGDQFGLSIDVQNNKLYIGAFDDDMPYAGDVGSAYIFDISQNPAIQDTKIEPRQGARNENLGFSVDLSNEFSVVGTPFDFISPSNLGSVYVYKKIGTKWFVYDKLIANDIENVSGFGYSVSIQGNHILVGAPFSKSAFVFELISGTWTQIAKLTPSEDIINSKFGFTVSLYGTQAFVGMSKDFTVNKVYLFEPINNDWQQTYIFENPAQSTNKFGISLSSSENAINIGDTSPSFRRYITYYYKKVGTDWQLQTFTKGSLLEDPVGIFGISLSNSNNTLFIGAPHYPQDAGAPVNSNVYVYEYLNDNWMETQVIAGNGIKSFGSKVSVNDNIAAIYSRPNNPSTYSEVIINIYKKIAGIWTYQNQIYYQGDSTDNDGFANALDVNKENILIGTPYHDEMSRNSGAAYIYNLNYTDLLFVNGFE